MSASIACPTCKVPLATLDVLDGGTVAIPEASILQFRCPGCGAGAWARLDQGRVAVGAPHGDPAQFSPGPAAAEPSLSVRREGAWLDCWHDGRYRRYPARREPAARATG